MKAVAQQEQYKLDFWRYSASLNARADLGVGPGDPPPPFCGLLNISSLHVQYGIQAFAKFKRPECTRLHLRELQSLTFSQRSMLLKLLYRVRRSQS